MKIKNLKCENCKSDDLKFLERGTQLGIYCAKCGRYVKWANKDERNLYELMNAPDTPNDSVSAFRNLIDTDEELAGEAVAGEAVDKYGIVGKTVKSVYRDKAGNGIVLTFDDNTVCTFKFEVASFAVNVSVVGEDGLHSNPLD